MHSMGSEQLLSRMPQAQQAAVAARALTAQTDPRVTPKVLLYSHDTFGLGNIRRSLLLGDLLSTEYPHASILLVTGSPMIHAFRIPERMDYVKLPCVDRVDAEKYEPRFLTACASEVRHTRAAIVERAVVGFQPDLLIVDKRPAGIDGELLPALEALSRQARRPRIVLGMRDILDAPALTRQRLREGGSFDVLERYYDEVWIYGSRDVFDSVAEYDFPPAVARMSRYCGYLRRRPVARRPYAGPPRVLVTTGGGADGEHVLTAYLAGLAARTPGSVHSVIVLGPQLAAAAAARVRTLCRERTDVEVVEFEPDLTLRYADADVVVAMAGYNTVCELLTAGARAVLVPRAEPVQEQLIRARRLATRGFFRMVEPSQLTPEHLFEHVLAAASDMASPMSAIDMDGLSRVKARVQRLLDGSKR